MSAHLDEAIAYEAISDWMPDFIAWAENPLHVGGPALLERARKTVWDSYCDDFDDLPEGDPSRNDSQVAAAETCAVLTAVAEWFVAGMGTPLFGRDGVIS